MLMRKFLLAGCCCLAAITTRAQMPDAMKMPDFIAPTPEVSALLKADNLSVSYSTGSPNINIPIGTITVSGISLPISLSYNSSGVKVDEYASNVGTGWTCSSGGVVSRTIFGKPDEMRSGTAYPTNLSNLNFSVQNAYLLSFLKNSVDQESDMFSFSFPGGSGKFILDSTLNAVIPLSNYNFKITPIGGNFLNGFQVVTSNGTTYRFEDPETSKTRNPQGVNCPKNTSSSNNITSWYLTKITAPNKRSFINFTYTTQDITFEQSINQYISQVYYTQTHPYTSPCPQGNAANVGSETYYTCVPRQTVTSKFISKITSSAQDTVAFYYDGSPRQDLEDGKRLSQIRISNYNGLLVKQATFHATYSSGIGSSSYTNVNKRMFLDSVTIDDPVVSANTLSYGFRYISRSGVPQRLTFAQDIFGYGNGKTSNASLIPILPSTDMNYSLFNNGTGSVFVTFGDRSVDTAEAIRGLLHKIIYPTGGYDTILYQPNKIYSGGTNKLVGGFSVKAIQSWSFGQKALEKSFSYEDSTNQLSTFVIDNLNSCSDRSRIATSGYNCSSVMVCAGPYYDIAHVSSDIVTPTSLLGGQATYHRNVREKLTGSQNNGYTEHHYIFFNGGGVHPYGVMGNKNLSSPLQMPAVFEYGEDLTKVYRYDSIAATYKLQKYTRNYLWAHGFTTYHNYVVKNNFMPGQTGSPPLSCEFEPFDVTKVAIDKFDVFTDSTLEITWDNNNDSFVVKTIYEYGNSAHPYPTRQTVYAPDGDVLETRKEYPQDGSPSVMTYRNIVAPVLVQKQYKNGTLLSTVTNTYHDWFNDSTVVALQQTEYKELSNSLPAHINYIGYDTLGNVLEIAKDSGEHKTYVWGYKKQIPIAAITNAAANEVFCTSFEESGGTADAGAKTGGSSHSGNYAVSFSLPNGKAYLLTYWEWNGSVWEYRETAYTGSTTITTANKIDELRIYPADAQVTTYTFEPMRGITSICDVRNMVLYYEYDALNRLKLIKDEYGKILKLYDYKYKQ